MNIHQKPLVYIVVLNWNGKKHLRYCLPSVMNTNYPNFKILVVDNGSRDGSQEFVQNFKKIELIENGKNFGFAEGNNIGIRYAISRGAKYITILSNDTIVDEDWVETAVHYAEKDKKIGMIGFNIFGAERPADIKDFYKSKKIKTKSYKGMKDYVCGCAMFVTRYLVEKIGMFDPVYFAYEEEIDWEKRAKKAGFRIVEVDIPVYHSLAATSKKIFLRTSFLQIRNTIRCSIKNDNLFQILRRCIAVLNTACNPFKRVDKNIAVLSRLRPFNPILNLILIVNAFAWNIAFLPQTLCSRWRRFSKY